MLPLPLLVLVLVRGARCDGRAEAGGEPGKGENWMFRGCEGVVDEAPWCALWPWVVEPPPAGKSVDGPVDWIVVSVVVNDRIEGAGDENVLPPPA